MKITTLLWCATVVAACANVAPPTAAETERLVTARRLLDQDPHQACAIADELLARNGSLRDARLLLGEGSLRIAQKDPRNRLSLLQDAVHNFELGLDGVADDEAATNRLLLAECQYELGEFAAGSATAVRAAAGFAELGTPTARRDAASAMLLAGRCDLQLFVQARQAELDGGDKDAQGRTVVGASTARQATLAAGRFAAARTQFPGETVTNLALIHRWLGQTAEVGNELERGLREFPGESAIHDAYIAWMGDNDQFDALVGSYATLVRAQPSTPVLRWHQGRATYLRADRVRRDGNFQGALTGYAKADAIFAEYGAMVPANLASANQWRALCNLARARVAVDMGDTTTAVTELLLAGERSPTTTTYQDGAPTLYDSFGGHFTGTAFAIHVALNESGDDALSRTLDFNEQLLQRFPDRWGFVYNNAALAARDLGVQKASAGDRAAAKDLWERSYTYYQKAVALTPDDARMVNDCGLMLLYHLDRDFDRARSLFERAIELGKQQLAALPTDTAAPERERLEEAVGDAYQNLAILARNVDKRPFADYRAFCEQSVRYFPYQRREAAVLLRTEGADDVASTARASNAATTDVGDQGGPAEALAKKRADIDAKAKAEDYDSALGLLEELSKECREHAPYHALRGQLCLQLAQQALAQNRKGTELFFQDAVAACKRAVELDPEPVAPRQLLAQAQYEANQIDEAVTTLTRLLLHLQSQGGGKPEQLLALHTLRARAAGAEYAQKKGADTDDKELLDAARASFRYVEGKGALDNAQVTAWAITEEWAGAKAEAVNVHVRALGRRPDDQALLDALVVVAGRTNQLPLAIEALQKRDDAVAQWYLGKARFWFADVQRNDKKIAEAQASLDQARAAFAASMQKNPAFRDSCEMWSAMVLGKKGNIAFQNGDLANAEAWVLEATKLRPDQIGTDLGLNETTKLGVQLVADHWFKKQNLAKVESIYRVASDAANGDTDLLNNSGLFARDYGNQLEAAGKKDEAMGMYEQSYKAYGRACQLDPANVRLRNDVALIAIHHLDRDWDQSKKWLDTAIADGEATLRDDPPKEPDDKQKLEEAVGDCYENLALWHLKHGGDAQAAKAAAEKSMTYYPKQRRGGARRHLRDAEQRLQGK